MSAKLTRRFCWRATAALCALLTLLGMNCPANPGNTTPNAQSNMTTATTGDRTGIFVTNFGGNSVTVFALDASGDAAPKRTIKGMNTGLVNPLGIGRNSQGLFFVANRSGSTVTAYPLDGNGDLTPSKTLTDPAMGSPEGIVVSISDEVFVSNCPTLGNGVGPAGVFRFLNSDTGADFVLAGANTGISVPVGLALDEARNLFVANAFGGDVALFAPGQSGDQFPVRSFSPGGNTQSIAYGNAAVLLGTGGSGINEYMSTASGNTAASGNIGVTGYTGGIFFDTSVTPPVVYVADFGGNAVHIIQTIGAAPFLSAGTVTTIQGPSTGLESPYGVLVVKT